MADPLLETDGLTRRFGALAAVDQVSLRFERGGIHALIGPNGAGKSTLMNLLSGELRASAGQVRFRSRDVTRAPAHVLSQLGIGRSYQTANVFGELTCAECVWLAAHAHGGAGDPLGECDLATRKNVPAGVLSYGEQRQLELAMVLATGAELLLLDEPLAGLGHDEALRVVALLRRIAGERTLLLVEHDMEAVFAIARTVTVMVNGRVLATGTPEAIRIDAKVREAYLGEEEA